MNLKKLCMVGVALIPAIAFADKGTSCKSESHSEKNACESNKDHECKKAFDGIYFGVGANYKNNQVHISGPNMNAMGKDGEFKKNVFGYGLEGLAGWGHSFSIAKVFPRLNLNYFYVGLEANVGGQYTPKERNQANHNQHVVSALSYGGYFRFGYHFFGDRYLVTAIFGRQSNAVKYKSTSKAVTDRLAPLKTAGAYKEYRRQLNVSKRAGSYVYGLGLQGKLTNNSSLRFDILKAKKNSESNVRSRTVTGILRNYSTEYGNTTVRVMYQVSF